MSFRAGAIKGVDDARAGTIEYRLARRHLINEYGRKRLDRRDICDAHPELIRAALHVGAPMPEPCPICAEDTLVSVSYVFGGRLPSYGRCITKAKELDQFSKQRGEYACYVVEICSTCRWNHLIRMFRLGRGAVDAPKPASGDAAVRSN
jgi:Family of unknown function (DUF5318)